MKKSLIALAVMAASGASMAQSNVTLYGIVDLWVGKISVENGAGVEIANPSATGTAWNVPVMKSGGVNGSRWGLKGEEDLGGGLKAVFKIESGFSADTGVGNSGPNRQSYVGLAGGFGEVTFGNVWSSMDDIIGAANSGFDSDLSAGQNVLAVNYGNGVGGYNDRPTDAFKYVSPSFGGFSGGFSYSLDEEVGRKGNQTDFTLSYGAGPIAANFGYEIQGDANGTTTDLKVTFLNGSYDLGMAKLLASFGQSKFGSAKSTDVQVGVDVPLSSALTLSAGYAQSKDNDAAGNQKRNGFGLAAAYSLSKRSTVYGGFRNAKWKTGGSTDAKVNVFAVGLNHKF